MVEFADKLQHEIHSNIATLFLQIIFILCLCRILGWIVQIFKQPPVVGEILAGIVMGPTVMGQSKLFMNFMFPAYNAAILKGISDLGVTFFMFILGLEFAPGDVLRSLKKTWVIGMCGILLPFGLGAAIAPYLYEQTHMELQEPPIGHVPFILFTGSAMSFTAFPVLARILTANSAMTAQIGLVSMGIASVDDVLAWTMLAIATSVTVGGTPQDGAWGVIIGAAWVAFLLVVVRSILKRIQPMMTPPNFIVVVFLGMCASAWFTQVLGLHAFFGGFVFGLCVPKHDRKFVHEFIDQLEVVVVNFFVPLFFANTGLRTDLTKLRSAVGPVLAVWALATVGKMLPPFVLGRCRGYTWRFSFQLSALMNARGLIELIALEVALETRAFNNEMYSTFVVMALCTTAMTGPMFWASYRPELDPPTNPRELAYHSHRLEKFQQAAGPGSPRKASVRQPSLLSKGLDVPLEEIAIAEKEMSVCRELPPEDQLQANVEYGYLFHGTYKAPEVEEPRATIAGVLGLPFLQPAKAQPASSSCSEPVTGQIPEEDESNPEPPAASPVASEESVPSADTPKSPSIEQPHEDQALLS